MSVNFGFVMCFEKNYIGGSGYMQVLNNQELPQKKIDCRGRSELSLVLASFGF